MNYKLEILKSLDILEKYQYDRRKIEDELKMSERYIDQILSKGGNKKVLNSLLQLIAKCKLQNPTMEIDEPDDVTMYKLEKESRKQSGTGKNKSEIVSIGDQALLKLANANEKLADANQRLAIMLERQQTTEAAPAQNYEAFLAMISNLQEVVLDLSEGKKLGNRNEVASLLYKIDHADPVKSDAKGTQNNYRR